MFITKEKQDWWIWQSRHWDSICWWSRHGGAAGYLVLPTPAWVLLVHDPGPDVHHQAAVDGAGQVWQEERGCLQGVSHHHHVFGDGEGGHLFMCIYYVILRVYGL